MQQITITESKGATLSEIKDVLSFSEKEIKAVSKDNRKIVLEGGGLKIVGFSKASGELTIEGNVSCAKYLGAHESLLKKVFK